MEDPFLSIRDQEDNHRRGLPPVAFHEDTGRPLVVFDPEMLRYSPHPDAPDPDLADSLAHGLNDLPGLLEVQRQRLTDRMREIARRARARRSDNG